MCPLRGASHLGRSSRLDGVAQAPVAPDLDWRLAHQPALPKPEPLHQPTRSPTRSLPTASQGLFIGSPMREVSKFGMHTYRSQISDRVRTRPIHWPRADRERAQGGWVKPRLFIHVRFVEPPACSPGGQEEQAGVCRPH